MIDGNSHAHLFLPWELMQAFLLGTDSSSVYRRRMLYEKHITAAGWDYESFWGVIDEAGREFRGLWQSVAEDQRRKRGQAPADDQRRTSICRARAAALEAARKAFGSVEFDRFLYKTMAPQRVMAFNPKAQTPEILLHVESGCR